MWSKIKFRLLWWGVGTASGLAIAGVVAGSYTREILRIEEQNAKFERLYVEANTKLRERVEKLTEENRRLKTSTKIVEKRNADGSSERIFENDTEAQSSKRSSETRSLEAELLVKVDKQHEEVMRTLKEEIRYRPSLNLSLGYNTNGEPYMAGAYTFHGPWGIHGYLDNGATLGVGISFSF